MKNEKEEIEMLDFSDDTPDYVKEKEEIEMLDFETDKKVSNEIDEMLDFMDDFKKTPEEIKIETNNLLEKNEDIEKEIPVDNSKLEIIANLEKVNEYIPSIKDLNIKNKKTIKIVRNVMVYSIIIMLFGFEFFINKTGNLLKDIRVYAENTYPIRIIENEKYGYIDSYGEKLIHPKYSYGEEFENGYAIVKDSSNLPLIIDKGGRVEVPTGEYFSLYRAGDDIVASKATKKGLKYGVLDQNLNQKVAFKYDKITYVDGAFTFVKDNNVGLLNLNGKEIFNYKLTETDNKTIMYTSSKINDDHNIRYAVLKINGSSMVVNLNDGNTVYGPTLDKIEVLDNNVFYKNNENNKKTYFYVYNNEIIFERTDFRDVSVDSIDSGIIKVLTESFDNQFISVNTKEQIHKSLTLKNVYIGDPIFIYEEHKFKDNKDYYVFVKYGKKIKEIEKTFEIYSPYVNGFATIKFSDGTFNYLDSDAKLLNGKRYLEAGLFDTYKEAIIKDAKGYGVINKKGKEIIKSENNNIKMISGSLKRKISGENNIFYAVKKDNKYALYDSEGKKRNNNYYNDVLFDNDFPILKVGTDKYDMILFSKDLNSIKLPSFKTEYKAYKDHIIIKDDYYNYKGKKIYTSKKSR